MASSYVQIDPKDNLIVAIDDLPKGTVASIAGKEITLKEDIKGKHKFTMSDVAIGDELFMYGVLIGKATEPIQEGCVINTSNVKHASTPYSDDWVDYQWTAPNIANFEGRTFNGYHRADGSVGTANYWLVIPLTFCENRNVDVLEGALSEKLGYVTKKDFTVDTEALISQYKSGASSQEILSTSIITTKEI